LAGVLLGACDASFGATPTPATDLVLPTGTLEPAVPLVSVDLQVPEVNKVGNYAQPHTLNVPPGFHVSIFAAGFQHPRMMALSAEGELSATIRAEGRIVRLPDKNKDGVADEVVTFADGIESVHGIAFRDNQVYAASERQLLRLEDTDGDGVADKREVLADDLPYPGVHSTRTIRFGPDGKLYLASGSSCNACVEQDERRAAISIYSVDGKFERVLAKGIRNAVGIAFYPVSGELWATNNGRDGAGENEPPENIYRVKDGGNYGWPYCYGVREPDPTMNPPQGICDTIDLPEFFLPPHYAPLGLTWYTGDMFPAEYKGDMIIAAHGSWDRDVRTGYKLVRVHFKDGQPDKSLGQKMVEDFVTGWLTDEIKGDHWGRPVDVLVAPDGSLYVTDDAGMGIYRITYGDTYGE
jgi:glucose/arabinose dehydrogenase